MFSQYNVNAFTSGPIARAINNPMVKIVNCFIEALNRFHTLPRFIVVVPDQDIIKAIDFYNFSISKIIQRSLEWMVRQFDRIIVDRKEKLLQVRPGAVVSLEPKIIWVKMLDRPGASRVMSLRAKFNAILEETLFKARFSYIMKIQLEASHFDRNNFLYPTGITAYWREFDGNMKKFNQQQIENFLKPEPVISMPKKRESNQDKQKNNRILPRAYKR